VVGSAELDKTKCVKEDSPMNKITMAATLRFITAELAYRNATRDSLVGKVLLSRDNFYGKKVIISNDWYDENPGTCWWAVINKPKGSNEIILKAVKGSVLAIAQGGMANVTGGVVRNVLEAYDKAETVKATATGVTGKLADEMYNQFDEAWKAGTWSAAKGTAQEFAIGLGYYIIGGPAAFARTRKGDLVVSFNCYESKNDFLNFMGSVERLFGNPTTKPKGGVKKTREYARAGAHHYMITRDSRCVKLDAPPDE
jgi:hypothetical protein